MTIGPSVGPAGTLKTSEKLKSTKTSFNFFLYIKYLLYDFIIR